MTVSERESMEFDVVIVGAGPAGLSAAIRLKQLDRDLQIVVLEKGSEVGAHILSGAVLDPIGINALIPDWKERGAPIRAQVKEDKLSLLTEKREINIPHWTLPKNLSNSGNYVVSMGNVCRWLAEQAEQLDVEIFPGMACSEVLYGDQGQVIGVVAGEFGKTSEGELSDSYEPGTELLGKYTLFSEGVRGSLSQEVIEKFGLDNESDVQKYGLGMKEIWEVAPEKHSEGRVWHSIGWPLDPNTGGGGFIYHGENNQVFVGFVVHLNYKNPYLFPYMEFQKFKQHPEVKALLDGGRRIAYGARAISEGGFQSMPKGAFPGGLLLGCSMGLVNVPRIKGNHNAMLSGKLAAEKVNEAFLQGRRNDSIDEYDQALREGDIGKDLKPVRNVKPLWSKYGLYKGLALGGFDMWTNQLFGLSFLGTLSHGKTDSESTGKSNDYVPVTYPKVDGVVSFDRLTNVSFSSTNHSESQPSHIKIDDQSSSISVAYRKFAGPSQRYCPAGVYEYILEESSEDPKFVVNFQNCLHCKTCDIKEPDQNIKWTTPQGGDGPNYPNM